MDRNGSGFSRRDTRLGLPDSHDFRKRGTHFPKAELLKRRGEANNFSPFLFLLSYLPAILSFVSARLYAFSSTPPEEKLSLPKEDPRVVPTFPTDRYPNFSIPWRDTVNLGGEETPSGRRRNKRADYREPPLYLFFLAEVVIQSHVANKFLHWIESTFES